MSGKRKGLGGGKVVIPEGVVEESKSLAGARSHGGGKSILPQGVEKVPTLLRRGLRVRWGKVATF